LISCGNLFLFLKANIKVNTNEKEFGTPTFQFRIPKIYEQYIGIKIGCQANYYVKEGSFFAARGGNMRGQTFQAFIVQNFVFLIA